MNKKLTNNDKKILKRLYRELGYSDYYIEYPDKIIDFHGEDLQKICLRVYKFTLSEPSEVKG